MCLVDFNSRGKVFSLFSVRSDGDIEDDDAIAVAIKRVLQPATGTSAKMSHDSEFATSSHTSRITHRHRGNKISRVEHV